MENCITREEHEEFSKRMDDEHRRQNKRIEILEESVEQINSIATSTERLATSMESMLKEQERQGKRLDAIEKEPANAWQRVKSKALDTAVGIIAGALVTGAVIMIVQYI